ncbi:MAG: hypothetical protein HY718_03940 [Planctomycetes bacterium]|nr:hypothetical protein [Planctomycetota bacterium]
MTRSRALTLIEVLIIVIVLAILAAVMTPQFTRASSDTRLTTLKAALLDVRAQIRLYHAQHADRYPTLEAFIEQMTSYTSVDGRTSRHKTGEFDLGPYLSAIPVNPYTGGKRVGDGPAGASAWYYDQATGLFRANHDPAFTAH